MSLSGVECREVTRIYRSPASSVEALHSVSACFPGGTIGAVVGPSGSGKSTLLRLIGGLDASDSGLIVVGDVVVSSLRGAALRAHRRDTITYLAQRASANLVPYLTVREQLSDLALAEELGLHARLGARASELSGGEQARAALAVALARGTPVLLVDEPTAELDRATAAHVLEVLQRAADSGRTVIVATHDPDLVARAGVTLQLGAAPAALPAPPVRARAGAAAVLSVRDLSKSYGGARVVDGVSLDLSEGELGVVIGRSGSGKSTLLMVAGGWLALDGGAVTIPGKSHPPRWSELSYLPQRFGLLPELTVAENVALPRRLTGRDGDVERVLERLELAALAHRLPLETSIGQQQRTALARAIVLRPKLLLADEPTSHQDGASAELVWSALADACAAGTTCLVATHDEAAASRADRLWRIRDGRLQA